MKPKKHEATGKLPLEKAREWDDEPIEDTKEKGKENDKSTSKEESSKKD